MNDTTNWAERRQFGRRPLNADATAELGAVEVPCVIENLSEGGALLSFPSGVAPISLFELVVDGVSFKLKCEMRYQVGERFGVRFLHVTQGEALVRYYFPPTTEATQPAHSARKSAERDPAAAVSVRQLRESLFPIPAPDAQPEPELVSEPASASSALQEFAATVPVAAPTPSPTPPAPSDRAPANASNNPFARLLGRRRA